MRTSRFHFLMNAVWLVGSASQAQIFFPNTGGSMPPNENPAVTPVSRTVGAQVYVPPMGASVTIGMLYRFSATGITAPVAPLDLGGAQAFVQIGAGAPLTCTATASPALNQCGFKDGSNIITAGDYAVSVLYNGLFPDGTAIEYWVTGVKTNAGSNPPSVAQSAFSAPDHVRFLTKSVTRTPVSAAMVLDVSGSMASSIVGGSGTRLAALQSASEVFLNLLRSLPADPNDRVGAVFFSTNAPVPDSMIAATQNVMVDTLIGTIGAKVANGSTSIGDGLLKGRDLIKSTSPNTNARSILLFSDGEQNTAPNTDGSLNISGAAAAADNGQLDPSITKVCPVTLGDLTTPGFTLMKNIAASRCGARYQHVLGTSAGPDLTLFFAQALENAFIGDKLETSKMLSGALSPSTSSTQTETFAVNSADQYLKIVLSWDAGQTRSLPFQLQAPDGTVVDPQPFTVVGRSRTSVTSIAFPIVVNGKTVQKAGNWKIVIGSSGAGAANFGQLQFSGLILLDNALLDSNFEASNPGAGTGEPIRLRVTLKEGGKPVTGATVIAQMAGPQQGLGDILATQPTPAGLPTSADPLTPAQAKLAALEANPATQGLFLPQNLPAVTLLDDGMHDDGKAGDGVYGAFVHGHQP